MSHGKLLMSFAVNDCKAIVSVEHVDRGAACGCFCPECGEPVVAKQGDRKMWHFAHLSGNDCATGAETALHKAAKQIIFERRELVVPSITVSANVVGMHSGKAYWAEERHSEATQTFERVLLEQPMATIIPDAIGIFADDKLLIEIAVTNPVNDDKRVMIEQLNFPAIEIALDPQRYSHWDWNILHDEIIINTTNKIWLHYPRQTELHAQAQRAAWTLAAEEAPLATAENEPVPVLTKLSFRGKTVRLTEYPFGLVAWSPYDPVINEIFKCFGAKWQPRYRNWLLSLKVKQELIKAFC